MLFSKKHMMMGISFSIFLLTSCSKVEDEQAIQTTEKENISNESKVKLKFLDEYIYPLNGNFKNLPIGGLSGIDYDFENDLYYIVSDDPNNPRYYTANIDIKNSKINKPIFTDMFVFDKKAPFYSSTFLDLESILYLNNQIIISSEGNIYGHQKPSIFSSDKKGNFLSEFTVPNIFLQETRNNGSFESLTKSFDKQGIWSANELPLKTDGSEPDFPQTNSPVRFTYYDQNTRQATKEFIYELSALTQPRINGNDMNGVSDILEYKKDHFLVIERAFQNENIVKIFDASITTNSTNSFGTKSLKSEKYIPMKKELVLDFNDIKKFLKQNKIDNIEGITFGKNLPNGNRTIIVISDDNFQQFGPQLNQFILFELIEK
ncbi:esterase-like activity of phytase family protein [Flavobacterium davisii]|uniref:esterase-like activity of phytase family protein n=1 Tax=Flavobacterium davisii TaxID=2906077 RepID=UPI0013FD67F6|nr:esterase-like activity of phytase family protein [Flavobacterium davisii]